MPTMTRPSPWRATASGDRIEWNEIRDRVDLASVATALLGPAPGRRGERGLRLWWRCPFHEDSNPSFFVELGKPWWRCWGCSEHGDAARLIMRLNGVTFPEAVRRLAEQAGVVAPSARTKPRYPRGSGVCPMSEPPIPPPERPSGLPLAEALALVAEVQTRLWTPEGTEALAYLRGRGLTVETIKAARLGWTPGVAIPTRGSDRRYQARGVVIPWFDGHRLALAKVRQPEGRKPKYAEAYRDRPTIFPGPAAVRPGKPLVIVEGEFDALLLGQALADLAAAVTLGSASSRPGSSILGMMLTAPVWYVATDNDPAGDKATEGWPARAVRVRPPGPYKDWTEAAVDGVDLRRWWSVRLGGTETPPLFTWDELASWRWGPALNGQSEGGQDH